MSLIRFAALSIAITICAACGTEPAPLTVEIRNDWDTADRFTVVEATTDAPLVEELSVGAHETRRVSTETAVRPGDSMSLRLVRVDGQDATFFRTITAPDAFSDEGATVVFHLATDKSTPSCPAGRTTCVLWSWAGQNTPPELF